jgi:outer membrane protein assembly factor BamB
MKFPCSLINKKQTASFRIVGRIAGLVIAIASLGLMLNPVHTPVHAQSSNVVAGSSATISSPGDWTQFLTDNMQRWNPSEKFLGVSNVGNLKLKWKTAPACQSNANPLSSPAVANGVVYFGCSNSLYALNASTGAKLWSFATGGAVTSSPAVANGVIYFSSDNLYALNATTGAKLWSFAAGGEFSPTLANGVVYFGGDFLYALNATTGALLWEFADFPNPAPFPLTSPAVANGAAYFGSTEDLAFWALDAGTGAGLWSRYLGSSTSGSPAVANGTVYFNGAGLTALNATTGTVLWSSFIRFPESSPAVANGLVYDGSGDGSLHALNATTGARLWTFYGPSAVQTSPAVANGIVYIADGNGSVYGLNAGNGDKLWSYATGISGATASSPAIIGGVLYIRVGDFNSGTSSVYAFSIGADLFLRVTPSTTTVHQGNLITYAFPVWNLGPDHAVHEVLNTQVPAGTTFDYIRISGTPGLGTCTTPPYQGTGQIVCHENSSMAPNTTWTVRLTVKVTAPSGTVITENAATMADTPDPNLANNTATVTIKVQ